MTITEPIPAASAVGSLSPRHNACVPGLFFGRSMAVPKLVPSMNGIRPGVIYLPRDLPARAYVPGGTLIDVILHEYAHAWHWLEPAFFE